MIINILDLVLNFNIIIFIEKTIKKKAEMN